MRKVILLFSPLAGTALLEFLLLGWVGGETLRDLVTPFSALVASLCAQHSTEHSSKHEIG